jgi:hypothetical protein
MNRSLANQVCTVGIERFSHVVCLSSADQATQGLVTSGRRRINWASRLRRYIPLEQHMTATTRARAQAGPADDVGSVGLSLSSAFACSRRIASPLTSPEGVATGEVVPFVDTLTELMSGGRTPSSRVTSRTDAATPPRPAKTRKSNRATGSCGPHRMDTVPALLTPKG